MGVNLVVFFQKKKGMKRRKEKGYFVVTLVMLTLDWVYSNVAFTIIGNSFWDDRVSHYLPTNWVRATGKGSDFHQEGTIICSKVFIFKNPCKARGVISFFTKELLWLTWRAKEEKKTISKKKKKKERKNQKKKKEREIFKWKMATQFH